MTITIRRPWRLIAALAVIGLLAAGFVAYETIYRAFPANHVDLLGTSWTVSNLEGAPSDGQLGTIAFRRDGTALVTTGCEAFTVSWSVDSSGDSMWFDNPPLTPSGCSPDISDQDKVLRRALEGVRTWLVDSPSRIELHGADRVTLTLVPPTA